MYSGDIYINGYTFRFDYQDKTLRLKAPLSNNLRDYSTNVLVGKMFPYDNRIVFYNDDAFHRVGYSLNSYCDLVFTFSTHCTFGNNYNIKCLKFELDELDYSYNIDESLYISELFGINKDSVFERFPIVFGDYKIFYSIEVEGPFYINSLNQLSHRVFFCLYFDFNDNYKLIFDMINHVRNLFSFLNYRKNIIFKSIIFSTLDSGGKYIDSGSIGFNPHFYNDLASQDYIISRSISFDKYYKYISHVFQNLIDEKIGIRNIPDNHIINRIYTPERIIMISSSFEMIYKNLGLSVTHSEKSINSNNKIKIILDSIIETNELNSSERKKISNFKTRLNDESFSSKLNEVLKRYKFIELEIKNIFNSYGRNYDKYNLTNTLERLRNNTAHYNVEKIPKDNQIVALICLEYITYSLQFYISKVDEESIIEFASRCIH